MAASISLRFATLVAGILLLAGQLGYAQGRILFATGPRGPEPDARVTFLTGEGVGPEFTGQLYLGPAGTPIPELRPVFPTARFSFPPEGWSVPGYIWGGELQIDEMQPGSPATVIMRAYAGETWETSLCRGESEPITVILSGGLTPASLLTGLQPFTVDCIPEPGVMVLAGVGAAGLWMARRGGRQAQFR